MPIQRSYRYDDPYSSPVATAASTSIVTKPFPSRPAKQQQQQPAVTSRTSLHSQQYHHSTGSLAANKTTTSTESSHSKKTIKKAASTNDERCTNSNSDENANTTNINEIRRLVREQSNIMSRNRNYNNNNNFYDSDDDSSDAAADFDISVRKFTPLPDIPRMDDPFFRTESSLIREDDNRRRPTKNQSHDSDSEMYSYVECHSSRNLPIETPSNLLRRNETMMLHYHFPHNASVNAKRKYRNYRLPSLEKRISHTIQSTMDLDEDLPMNPVANHNEPDHRQHSHNQIGRQIYTSPGDRIISPIKRPQAPSPAASAYRRSNVKTTSNNSDSDSNSDSTDLIVI